MKADACLFNVCKHHPITSGTPCKRMPAKPLPSVPCSEPLESRTLLSTTPASLLFSWPASPFQKDNYRGTIYTNQNGDAFLDNQFLGRARPFGGYEIYYDDPGTISFRTTGRMHTQIAYYNQSGPPARVRDGGVAGAHHALTAKIPADKRMLYLGVLAYNRGTIGTYGLKVDGPIPEIENIPVPRTVDAGSSGSDISGSNDADFYQFTVPHAANWIVKVIPDRISGYSTPPLDATLNVYDSQGNPVGGTFTQPINEGGSGVTERWTGIGLRAGATYYFRVDGSGDSVGGYGVSVEIADLPTVTVASKSNSPKPASTSSQFVVTRSESSSTPLKIDYTVSTTDSTGKPSQPRPGSIVIPANRTSATITVKPPLDNSTNATETVILTLSPSPLYNVGSQHKAASVIANRTTATKTAAAAKARSSKRIDYQGPIT
ncbi:MAG: hypothetical protein ACM359_14520, partial [Bacillota bacterium]